MWGRRASARLIEWQDDSNVTIAVGEHDGYLILPDPVVHRRTLQLDKKTNSLSISDSFIARDNHKVRLHFHLDSACLAKQASDNRVEIMRGDTKLVLTTNDGLLSCIRATENTKLGWVSEGYHQRQASTCIRLEQDINGDTTIETTLSVVSHPTRLRPVAESRRNTGPK